MGHIFSSNLENSGSTRETQVWTWEARFKIRMVFRSACSGKPRVWFRRFWRSLTTRLPRETESGCKKTFRTWKTESDAMKASRKHWWIQRRCTLRCGRDLWLHRCGRHCTWARVTKASKACSGLQVWWSKDFQKLRMYSADVASSLTEKSVLLDDQAIRWTKARVYVYSDSVFCLVKMQKKWTDQVSTLKMSHLQGIVWVWWRADWLRVEKFSRSHSIGPSPRNSGRSARKARHTWKFQWSNYLHVHVQRHWSRKERKWRFLWY